jgi:GNAT superfamily N-acetyltransferase
MHEQSSGADPGAQQGSGSTPLPLGEEPLKAVPLAYFHRVRDFRCKRSERINSFLIREAPDWMQQGYCRVFVLPNPADPTEIWAYYSLSAGQMLRAELTGSLQKRVPGGIPVPLMRIGFMGRADFAPAGIGGGLIEDAARRVYREGTAWGLILESEGGHTKPKLLAWYQRMGFTEAKHLPGTMYGPLQRFLPELAGKPPAQWPPRS